MSTRRCAAVCALVLAGIALAAASPARGDGGAVLLRGAQDGIDLTLFGEPAPLRVGAVDLSVLVQDAATGEPRLDGEVEVVLDPAQGGGGATAITLRPDAARATNKLLRAATTAMPASGRWRARVAFTSGGRRAETSGDLEVGTAPPAFARSWPWLVLPVVATALFAWREWLRLRRPRGAAAVSGPESRPRGA